MPEVVLRLLLLLLHRQLSLRPVAPCLCLAHMSEPYEGTRDQSCVCDTTVSQTLSISILCTRADATLVAMPPTQLIATTA